MANAATNIDQKGNWTIQVSILKNNFDGEEILVDSRPYDCWNSLEAPDAQPATRKRLSSCPDRTGNGQSAALSGFWYLVFAKNVGRLAKERLLTSKLPEVSGSALDQWTIVQKSKIRTYLFQMPSRYFGTTNAWDNFVPAKQPALGSAIIFMTARVFISRPGGVDKSRGMRIAITTHLVVLGLSRSRWLSCWHPSTYRHLLQNLGQFKIDRISQGGR